MGEVHVFAGISQHLIRSLHVMRRDVEVSWNFMDHHLTFNLTSFLSVEASYCLLKDIVLIFLFQLGSNL